MSRIRETHTDPSYPSVDVDDAVLVLLHLQNDFLHPDGVANENATPSMLAGDEFAKITQVIEVCREAGIPVIHLTETYRPGHPELRISRNGYAQSSARRLNLDTKNAAVRGTWGAEIMEQFNLDPSRDEFEVESSKVDPFNGTEFEIILTNLDRHILILGGQMLDFGISITARNASDRDYGVVVLSDCVDRAFGQLSELTITTLLPYYGRVADAETVIAEIRGAKSLGAVARKSVT